MTKVNLPIGETKNRVPFVKVRVQCGVGVACLLIEGCGFFAGCD